jgi:hypothetical protein
MTKFSGVFIQLSASAIVAVAVYALFCYLLGSEEYLNFVGSLKKRWPFKKVKIEDQGEARSLS